MTRSPETNSIAAALAGNRTLSSQISASKWSVRRARPCGMREGAGGPRSGVRRPVFYGVPNHCHLLPASLPGATGTSSECLLLPECGCRRSSRIPPASGADRRQLRSVQHGAAAASRRNGRSWQSAGHAVSAHPLPDKPGRWLSRHLDKRWHRRRGVRRYSFRTSKRSPGSRERGQLRIMPFATDGVRSSCCPFFGNPVDRHRSPNALQGLVAIG